MVIIYPSGNIGKCVLDGPYTCVVVVNCVFVYSFFVSVEHMQKIPPAPGVCYTPVG